MPQSRDGSPRTSLRRKDPHHRVRIQCTSSAHGAAAEPRLLANHDAHGTRLATHLIKWVCAKLLTPVGPSNSARDRIASNRIGRAKSDILAARANFVATPFRLSLLLAGLWIPQLAAQTAQIDFRTDIEPIFRQHCIACHGPASQSGACASTEPPPRCVAATLGPAIKAGDGAGSRLVQMLSRPASEGPVMPLGGVRLPTEQINRIAAWIDQGAEWPDSRASESESSPDATHWSFLPPVRPKIPATRDAAWVRNPIDSFIAAKLESAGLEASLEAPRPSCCDA